ncbi:MAG: Ig-like domain-containing protein [Deltaproteobacteria bacterium]|nr:Ig-like domain-containing protein [Deltaproteobacteria bacterium]
MFSLRSVFLPVSLTLLLVLSGCQIPKVYRGTDHLLPTCLYCPDIAPPAAVTTPANVPVTLTYTVTDTDSPVVTLAAVKAPTKGTLSAFTLATTTGNMTSGYTFTFTGTYTPNTALSGADSFDLKATDNSPTPNPSLVPTVNVTVTPYLTGITVAPATTLVPRGTTKQFTATGAYNDGMNRTLPNAYNTIAWSSGTPANATINSTGLASLPSTGTITGTSVITATSGGFSNTSTLTVDMPTLVSIAVTPVTVPRGTSQQLTAMGNFVDGTTGVITTLMTWTSGTATNATIVSTSGLATAINTGNITGTSLITATDPASGKTGTATLTVGNPNLLSMTLSPANATILTRQTQQYTATGTFSDTTVAPLPTYGYTATWTSSNTASSTINASGLATVAYAGVGTSTITATSGAVTAFTPLNVVMQTTWVSGSSTGNVTGVYGTQGTAAATNQPGSRHSPITWVDGAGNFWMFGGYGYGSAATVVYLNDLWKWDGTNWTWMGGSSTGNTTGVYGAKGTAAAANMPGARAYSENWLDAAGNVWVFGGTGYDSGTGIGNLNDLWKWDGANWTWVSGSNLVNATGVYGTLGVTAAANVPGARQRVTTWKDAAGNAWLFGGSGSLGYYNDMWKWDGTNWTWIGGASTVNSAGVYGTKGVAAAANYPGARYSSTSWTDAAGNLWLFGGPGIDSLAVAGYLNDLWKWDGTNWTWMSGSSTANAAGVFGTKGVAAATNNPGSRMDTIGWKDSAGNFWLFSGFGYDSAGGALKSLNDLWKWDGTNWTWMGGSSTGNTTGVYGTKGTPAATNTPGARSAPKAWSDAAGNLWLIGGWGFDSVSPAQIYLNDLWKLSP